MPIGGVTQRDINMRRYRWDLRSMHSLRFDLRLLILKIGYSGSPAISFQVGPSQIIFYYLFIIILTLALSGMCHTDAGTCARVCRSARSSLCLCELPRIPFLNSRRFVRVRTQIIFLKSQSLISHLQLEPFGYTCIEKLNSGFSPFMVGETLTGLRIFRHPNARLTDMIGPPIKLWVYV